MMDDIPARALAIHAWAQAHYVVHPGAPDLAPSDLGAMPPPSGLAPLLVPGATVLLSPGVSYVFHFRGIFLARGIGRRLPDSRLRWQQDEEIRSLLVKIGGARRAEDVALDPDLDRSAHRRLRLAALAPPARTRGTVVLRRPGIVGLIGIEAQEIRLLALHLDDETWTGAPTS
jgi:hypothetical protein